MDGYPSSHHAMAIAILVTTINLASAHHPPPSHLLMTLVGNQAVPPRIRTTTTACWILRTNANVPLRKDTPPSRRRRFIPSVLSVPVFANAVARHAKAPLFPPLVQNLNSTDTFLPKPLMVFQPFPTSGSSFSFMRIIIGKHSRIPVAPRDEPFPQKSTSQPFKRRWDCLARGRHTE